MLGSGAELKLAAPSLRRTFYLATGTHGSHWVAFASAPLRVLGRLCFYFTFNTPFEVTVNEDQDRNTKFVLQISSYDVLTLCFRRIIIINNSLSLDYVLGRLRHGKVVSFEMKCCILSSKP